MSHTAADDARTGRERHDALTQDVGRGRSDADPGSDTLLVRAIETVSPPGFVPCHVVNLTGNPAVGEAATRKAKKATVVVASVGSAPMPTTKDVLAHKVGNKWMVQYDG